MNGLLKKQFDKDELKVGIVTYHRAINYGSVLQAYALNYYFRKNNCIAETIDFYTEKQIEMYKKYEPLNNLMAFVRNLQTYIYSSKLKIKARKFKDFIESNIPLSTFTGNDEKELNKLNDVYDIFVCGSDQIWNTNCGDFNPTYMLAFVNDKSRCYAYAPSIGVGKLNLKSEEEIRRLVTHFNKLSLREKSGSNYVSNIVGRKVETVLDPVFLLSPDEWEKNAIIPKEQKYILCYYIGDVDGMRKFTRELSKKTQLKLIVILKNVREMAYSCKKAYEAGPSEFLGLIKNAFYIVTNSFHAVAFSIVFKKQFWVFVDSNSHEKPQSRIYNIIDIVGLEERILDINSCKEVSGIETINYELCDKKLKCYIDNSKDYINNIIHDTYYLL